MQILNYLCTRIRKERIFKINILAMIICENSCRLFVFN
nr:MAG TPA: hypothetical protein [Caudoviricetes sp.]